jgi:NADH-quinone oxidoreductase subunit H
MAELLTSISIPPWLAYTIVAVVECVLLLIVALCSAAVAIWLERKVAARIQDRLGPTRVGGRFGWLQPPADGIKLLCKEDIIPAEADKPLFRIAPYISFCTALCVFIALPFSDGWVALHIDVGIFFILAVSGLEVFGVILGGYASGSKWSLYGAMRESAQVISYEIPMALCVVVPVLIVGSMDLVAIGNYQAGWFWNWLIFHDPFTFATFWIYLVCAIASTNRAPFDLAEAESELVAGFLTEYSGFRWVVYFMAEYPSMFIVSGLASILYLGGWNGPIPVAHILHLTPQTPAGAGWLDHLFVNPWSMHSWTAGTLAIADFLGNFLGMCNFIMKGVIGITCMIWLRWTLPRLRIDQVMTTCLKYCIPIASAMLAGAMLWAYFLPGGLITQAKLMLKAHAEAGQSVSSENLQRENTPPPHALSAAFNEFDESETNARHDASWNCMNREGRSE